ncbi:hypothetical protein C8R44DRAFT_683728 [Mycena epipterygia]|nr:hypothetical protein C8R44DRAFT_683728 [Mycena epipterygia]
MFFTPVKFYLPETLSPSRRSELAHGIERNGGKSAKIHSATHIITNSTRFQGWQDVDESVAIISDMWVDRSLILGQLLPCEFYSANPSMVFSGVVASASGMSPSDLIHLEAGVTALGGQWRHGLTKDVTHLFATSPNSDKYAAAIKCQEDTKMKILLPHWFDDAVRMGFGKLSTNPYEWPDPQVLHPLPDEVEGKKEKTERSSHKLGDSKRAFYKTANWDPDKGGPFPGPAEPKPVWDGRKVLLSSSLGLEHARRRVIEEAVEAAGGLIVSYTLNDGDGQDEEEFNLVSDCDVFVTRWRTGRAIFKAAVEGKIVGTLNWLFYVHATGVLASPMDQLIHYPTRQAPIQDFSRHQITITNYTGEARDYIKRLIHTMGARFTPNMTGSNTILIAAHMGGIKTAKALSWSIAVVNHTWLEDCFVQWRCLTPAVPKYIDFPPNVDFAPMLAERGVTIDLDGLGAEEEEDIIARAQPSSERPPIGTEASVREVEGILDDGDVVMDDDEDALEKEAYVSRFKPASGSRMVSASVSPTKHGDTDEEMMQVESEPHKPLKRSKQQAHVDDCQNEKTTVTNASKRGKQSRRSDEHLRMETQADAVKTSSSDRKGKQRGKPQVSTEAEEEIEAVKNAKLKGKGKEKEKRSKNGRVMFAPETETDSAGPSISKKPPVRTAAGTSAKRKAQLIESASDDDATDARQSDSPPSRKRTKSIKVTDTTSTSVPPNGFASSSVKRKMTAGPGRDSAPLKTVRTESLRVLADERSSAKPGTKKRPAIGATSAAAKTTQNETNNELMPDVVNYAPEERTQRSRDNTEREEMDSADEMPPPKASRSKTKAGKKNTTTSASSGSRTSRKSTTSIRIMTTTVNLPDHVLKTLSKLGAKPTTQISECTHLIAPSLVRTEKLLCALAFGAFILSDKWATDSADANTLLPENDYILHDKVNERKWNFRLVDAMARAKEVGGRLFENKTFYVTPKVPVDIKLLKNLITSQGGKLLTQAPTVRILNSAPGRYVISCPEDISIWRALTKDHAIYTQELLLSAALTQQIDWDNPMFRVPNSG